MPCLLTYLLKYVPTGTYHTSVPCVCADMQYIPQLFHVYSPPSQNMSVIIRRDFFPDLPKLEMQLEYIRASEEGDFMRMKELSARMTHTPGPGQCTGSGPCTGMCTCKPVFVTPCYSRVGPRNSSINQQHTHCIHYYVCISYTTLESGIN